MTIVKPSASQHAAVSQIRSSSHHSFKHC